MNVRTIIVVIVLVFALSGVANATTITWGEDTPLEKYSIYYRAPHSPTYKLLKNVGQNVISMTVNYTSEKGCYQIWSILIDPVTKQYLGQKGPLTLNNRSECRAMCVARGKEKPPLDPGECY